MTPNLIKIMQSKNVEFELLTFNKSVKDSKSSATATNLDLNKIVKTITFKDKQKKVYAIIIRSIESVDKTKIKKALNTSKLDLIQFESVEKYTGFPAGGVPPFGYDATFVIDSNLDDEEVVLVGGGTIYTLIKLKVKDIKKLSNPIILDVKNEK